MNLEDISNESVCVDCFKDTGGEDVCMNCGYEQHKTNLTEDIACLHPHTVLNKYIIGRVLSIDENCITYKAYDVNLERIVLIKELFPFNKGLATRLDDGVTVAVSNNEVFNVMKDNFILCSQKIRNTAHDSIVAFYDEFEANSTAYQVIEFIEGISLQQYFEQVQKLSFEESLDIMLPIMEAMDALHKSGVIYGSLSPDNIYISVGGDIKLGDFDNSIFTEERVVLGGTKIVDGYSCVGMYKNAVPDVQFDIYSVGAIWYRLLSGVRPPKACDRVKKDKIVPLSKLGAAAPDYVESIIFRAMSIKDKEHFATMEEFIKSVRGEGWMPKRKGNKLVSGIIAATLSLLLVVIAVITVSFITSNSMLPTKDATVTLWYVDNGDEGLSKRWDEIANGFSTYVDNQTQIGETYISLETVGIPEAEYEEQLAKAFEKGEAPDIYCSTKLQSNENAYSLTDIYSELEKESDDFSNVFNSVSSTFEKDNKIPLCYDLPVLYVSTRGSSYIPQKTDSLSALSGYKEDDERYFSDPLICNSKAALYLAYAYGYEDGKDNSVLKQIYDESRVKKGWQPTDMVSGSTKYYLGLLSEYNNFYSDSKCFGKFSVLPLNGDDVSPTYIFPEVWSVNKNSSKEEIKASVFLLYYLINTTEGQRSITNNNGNTYYMPFKTSVVNEILAIDKTYSDVLKEEYILSANTASEFAFETNKAYDIEVLINNAGNTDEFEKLASKVHK